MNISKNFTFGHTDFLARSNDEINLQPGTHYLLGRNGTGKTTLLRTLSDLLPPLSGKFESNSKKLFLAEDMHFDRELSPRIIFKSLLPKSMLAEALEMASKIELDTKLPYGKLSTGNKRKILLILSEYQIDKTSSSFIMMDEPLSGLDQEVRDFIQNRWMENNLNKTRLISYHPDNENASLNSAIIISNKELTHIEGDSLNWSQLRELMK